MTREDAAGQRLDTFTERPGRPCIASSPGADAGGLHPVVTARRTNAARYTMSHRARRNRYLVAVPNALFITGASGFIGRHLLERLDPQDFDRVTCLSRTPQPSTRPGVSWRRGDLLGDDGWSDALDSSTVVLHLAATTGKATAAEHFRVNAEGTERVIHHARERRVRGIVLVSTIAAAYRDTRDYPYAGAKRRAEEAVRASGLPFAIVRPTVVLGRESPIWMRFRQLAGAPVIPLIGGGGARIQPIHVRDLADALAELARGEMLDGQRWGLGGPEALSISSFLQRLHGRLHGGRRPRMLHVPYAPLRLGLGLAEPVLHGLLPITAGQLALFVNDGTVEPNDLLRRRWPTMMDVDAMLDALTTDDA